MESATLFFSDKPFKVNKAIVDRWFNHFNKEIFEGKLKPFKKVRLSKMKPWADCTCFKTPKKGFRYCHLSINPIFPSIILFFIVLVHEMVHAYQWQIQGEISHGNSFFAWKHILKKYHIPLEIKVGENWQVITKAP